MNVRWKEWAIIAGGLTITLMLMNSVMAGNWSLLLLFLGLIAFIVLVVLAKSPIYLAFGALAPFAISLGPIHHIPPLALALAICTCAIGIKAAAKNFPTRTTGRFAPLIAIFYLLLAVRYCMDPVLPGYAIGIGDDVTGFRSWLDHLIGFGCVLLLGFFITSLVMVKQLFRSLLAFSILFAVVALIIMLIPGMALTRTLASAGIAMGEFSNGWRRFLFLPSMGQFMIVGCLLPNLFATTRLQRSVLLILGIVSVVAGGNRGSALALLVIIGAIWVLKRKPAAVIALMACSIGLILLANVIVEQGWGKTLTPWTRVMSAFSPSLSTEIGATSTVEWRIARWQRALEDIRTHPWLGMGYGGVRGYFRMMSDIADSDPDLELERDVATGLTHNGYISSARALGIPITVLFILIMAARIRTHIKQARRYRADDKVFFEGHVFMCAYLVMMLFALMFGAETRYPTLWMFIALSLILERLKPDEPADNEETFNTDATARTQTPALPIARFF